MEHIFRRLTLFDFHSGYTRIYTSPMVNRILTCNSYESYNVVTYEIGIVINNTIEAKLLQIVLFNPVCRINIIIFFFFLLRVVTEE